MGRPVWVRIIAGGRCFVLVLSGVDECDGTEWSLQQLEVFFLFRRDANAENGLLRSLQAGL